MSEERLAETIERLHRLVEPLLEREGLELVDLELKRGPKRYLLRVTIDKAGKAAYRGSAARNEGRGPAR
jgi:ribosome maturation factor RimP